MDKFPGLTPEQREHLHQQTVALGDTEALRVFVYDLLTHDNGKNEEVRASVGADAGVDHDQVHAMLVADPKHIEARRRWMPGFDNLPEWGQNLLVAKAQAEFNYAQILQGEAPADALQPILDAQDPQVLNWSILEAKFDIFGARGHETQEVALTATAGGYRRMENLDGVLRDPTRTTAQECSDAFYGREIEYFMGSVQPQHPQESADLKALAKLGCHLRVEDKEDFDALRANFAAQPPAVKAIIATELNRDTRATLAYYSPAFVRTVTARAGGEFALRYLAHVLQEAHISDIEARKTGLPGISTVLLDDLIHAIKRNEIDLKTTAIRFETQEGALVAVPRKPSIETLEHLPEFNQGEMLRGKRIILVGEGGGSDGIQAAIMGKVLAAKYGCEIAGVVSARNAKRQVANTGWESGALKEITPSTEAVGDWRFLEAIPLEGHPPTPMFIHSASDPHIISRDIRALVNATGADIIIGVDTGGDSLYRSLHPGFSAPTEADITPDHDYITIEGLVGLAADLEDVPVLSMIVAPGVDSPQYAREVLEQANATRLSLSDSDVAAIQRTYAEWRMDGSGSEEGRYGKTPLAWLHALNGRTGLQLLELPRRNLTSNDNPWRAFMQVTPAMSEVVLLDMKKHFAAIQRNRVVGPKEPAGAPKTQEIIGTFKPQTDVRITQELDRQRELQVQYVTPAGPDKKSRQNLIGGYGMTRRTLESIGNILPGVKDQIQTVRGKIVFLGNGFSLAPLEALEHAGSNKPEIVVADAVDYRQLQYDLARLKAAFDAGLVEPPSLLLDTLERCNLLLDAQAAGSIKLVQHTVGGDTPLPQAMQGAQLAVNVYGPPMSTVDQQLECLSPGGKLYTTGAFIPVQGVSAHLTPIRDNVGIRGYMMTKTSE
jgi:hypothetical protein